MGHPETKSFFEEGKALIDAGCNDPMVLFAYGSILLEEGRVQDAELPLRLSVEGFKKSTYHKCRAQWALRDLARSTKNAGEPNELRKLAFQWMLDSYQDGSYKDGEQRIALENFDFEGLDNWADFLKAIENKPPKDPYIDRVIRARCHFKTGWSRRGNEYAYKVSDEKWAFFEKELGIARKLLIEAWKLHPEFPEAPYEMIKVARSISTPETPRLWFDRTVAAQMDFIAAYGELRYSMYKQWDDDIDGIYQLGAECVKTGRYDTLVPAQFISALNDVSSNGDKSYWTNPKTAKFFDMMYAGYAKSGRIGTRERVESQEAAAAFACKRYERAKSLIVKLESKLDQTQFNKVSDLPFSQIKEQIFALSSIKGAELRKANDLIAQNRKSEALAIYDAVSKTSLGDSLADTYVKDQTRRLRTMTGIESGEWTEVSLTDFEKDWESNGIWSCDSDGWLTAAKSDWRQELKSRAIYRQAFELEAELNFGDEAQTTIPGIGFYTLGEIGSNAYEAQVSRAKKQVGISNTYSSLTLVNNVDIPKICRFRMQVWAGIVSIFIDDKPIITAYRISFPVDLDGECNLTITDDGKSDEGKVGIRHLKIRKLKVKPAGMEKVEPWDTNAFRKRLQQEQDKKAGAGQSL